MHQDNKNQSLDTAEIKSRSIKGAKWLLVMNVLGIPSAFLIALMLGRTGPEALGTYALVQILIGTISTFVVYGGQNVLSVFIPKIKDSEDRGRFVFTYFLILLVFMILVISFFRIFPSFFEFLIQREFDMRNYGWFILLSILIVATEVLANTASGLMLIKTTAIARQMMRLVLLPVVASLYIFNRQMLLDYGMPWIIGGVMTGYLIACLICVFGIGKDNRFQMRSGLLLPSGFWAFSLATMAATIFTFLYGNFDRLAVLSIKDVAGLGIYQAVISINQLIDLLPRMLGSTLVPMFSSLLATENKKAIQKAYDLLQKTGSTMMTLSAIFLIAYSLEIMSFFGEAYKSYAYLLSIFCLKSVITAPYFGNTPVLIAYQKNAFRFSTSTAQIILQITGTILFIEAYGVLAIAVAKIAGAVLSQCASILYVCYGMQKGFTLPKVYKAGVVVTIVLVVLQSILVSSGFGISTILFLGACFLFYLLGGLKYNCLIEIYNVINRKRRSVL